jgi:hypothetical protein
VGGLGGHGAGAGARGITARGAAGNHPGSHILVSHAEHPATGRNSAADHSTSKMPGMEHHHHHLHVRNAGWSEPQPFIGCTRLFYSKYWMDCEAITPSKTRAAVHGLNHPT